MSTPANPDHDLPKKVYVTQAFRQKHKLQKLRRITATRLDPDTAILLGRAVNAGWSENPSRAINLALRRQLDVRFGDKLTRNLRRELGLPRR